MDNHALIRDGDRSPVDVAIRRIEALLNHPKTMPDVQDIRGLDERFGAHEFRLYKEGYLNKSHCCTPGTSCPGSQKVPERVFVSRLVLNYTCPGDVPAYSFLPQRASHVRAIALTRSGCWSARLVISVRSRVRL